MKRTIPRDAYELPHQVCPWCAYHMTLASEVSLEEDRAGLRRRKPKPGDCTMCARCGELCTFTADLTLVKPSDDDLLEMGQDKRVQLMRQAWVRAEAERKAGR